MSTPIRVGSTARQSFRVDREHAIEVPGGGVPPLLSTPTVVLWLELTARDLMTPSLSADQCTVGIVVEVEHIAATPLGATVNCEVRVVHVDGPTIAFRVEARDDHEPIATGFHKRRIVAKEKLARKLARKAAPEH